MNRDKEISLILRKIYGNSPPTHLYPEDSMLTPWQTLKTFVKIANACIISCVIKNNYKSCTGKYVICLKYVLAG